MAPSCKQPTAKDLEVHRCVPAPFLTKTYQLVEDLSTDEIISWNDNGSTFVVWKAAEFARDLLPNYFKHNNFSSFVRQLNTYGFRKTVPDRWEFANEFFRRGEKELLSEIHRRKTTIVTQNLATGKINLPLSSPSNSGEDQGSSSTSSASRKGVETANSNSNVSSLSELSDENEKLKKDNTKLSWELAETKKQCQELLNFLSKYVNVDPDYIRSVMEGGEGSNPDLLTRLNCTAPFRTSSNSNSNSSARVSKLEEDEDEEEAEEGERLKLFGVSLKVFQGKKRGRSDRKEEAPLKEMKMDLEAPWMKLSSPRGSKVCN